MNKSILVAGSVLAFAIAGCGDNSSTTPPTTQTAAPANNGDTVAALKAEADKILADVSQYVKDNKWDLADKGMARLVELKPKLPAEYGPKIDQLKSALDAAKAAAAKLPGGLKAP